MKNYLFVCSQGEKRSPTAAAVAREIAQEKDLEILATSGGIDVRLMLPKQKMKAHFKQYDLVFAMETYMVYKLEKKCGVPRAKIICLNIEDQYGRHDPRLREELREKLDKYIK